MLNDIANFRVDDPCPELGINDVYPFSKRARCLAARNKSAEALRSGFLNVEGAMQMLEGLDYHHDNFMRVVERLTTVPPLSAEERSLKTSLSHEAVAYINRAGQLMHFARSSFVIRRISNAEALLPRTRGLKSFRDKITAHRSIDSPQREDTPHLQETHAMIGLHPDMFFPKPGKPRRVMEPDWLAELPRMWSDCYVVFQIQFPQGVCQEFSIERDHPRIAQEVYSLIEKLIERRAEP